MKQNRNEPFETPPARSYRWRSLLGVSVIAAASAQAGVLGPTPYLSFTDSPFASTSFNYFHLENFEDGVLNTPGVNASVGFVVSPGTFTDSVDGDDGAIDGSGTAGHSWYLGTTGPVVFTFDATVLGALPTHAGIVWTDVGAASVFGTGQVRVEAFGPGNVLLGTLSASLGDGLITGTTAEDRFFGFSGLGPIEKLTVLMDSQDWEIDHLQYGAIPEPTAGAVVLGLAALGLVAYKRQRWAAQAG